MATLRHVLKSMTFERLVPEMHVLIIEKDGQIDRLADTGYVRINRLTEKFGDLIKVGPQQPVKLTLKARTLDGEVTQLDLQIFYGFNPHNSNYLERPNLVRDAPLPQSMILKTFAEQEARDAVATYKAYETTLGQVSNQLEAVIKNKLQQRIGFAGVEVYNLVVNVTPPRKIDRAYRAMRVKQVELKTVAREKVTMARITEVAQKKLTNAKVYELERIIIAKMEEHRIRLELMNSINPDLAKEALRAEVLRELAQHVKDVNLLLPFPMGIADPGFTTMISRYAALGPYSMPISPTYQGATTIDA